DVRIDAFDDLTVEFHHHAQHAVRRRVLRTEVDRVVGDGQIARGFGGIDRIAFEHVAAVVLDGGSIRHASPPLSAFGLRGARGLAGAFAVPALDFAAALFAFLPAPVCSGFAVVLGVGGV